MNNIKLKGGGTYDSVEDFEKRLKNRNNGPIVKIEKDVPITVRFLADPDGWLGYEEHYTEEFAYFPCTDEGCPGCDEGHRASSRSLAPALDVETGRVIVIQIPKQLGETFLKRWKRNRTLMDRDYELSREGEGRMDTKYDAIPGSPTKRDISKYTIPDLEKQLFRACSETFREFVGLELDEEEEAPKPKKKAGRSASRPAGRPASKRRPEPEPEEDEDDEEWEEDEDDEEDEEEFVPVRRASRRPARRR